MQEKLNKKEETEQMPTFCWKSVEEKISLRTQRQFFPWGEAEDARKINFLDELKDGSISKKKKKDRVSLNVGEIFVWFETLMTQKQYS